MVHLKLHWSREHIEDFSKQVYNQLLKDKDSDYFDITFHLNGCDIHIDEGDIKQ